PPTPTSKRSARTRSVSQNGTPNRRTALPASIASRSRSRCATRTNAACPPSRRMPYGWVATASSAVSTQSAQRPLPPRSSAFSRASVQARAQKRNRLYMRPYTPWNRKSQLDAKSAVATSPTAGPARRRPSSATSGRLASANAAEAKRRPPSPNPRCATAHATRKCSGAPPRSRVTCSTTPGSESRPTKSASVSSSCGGHAISWCSRNAAAAPVTPATPSQSQCSATQSRAEGRAAAADAVSTRASIPCVIGVRPPSLVDWPSEADLRISLSERAHVRGLPADERSPRERVRDVRRRAGREGAVPRGGPLQGLGLLCDRLRSWLSEVVGKGRRLGIDVARGRSREGQAGRDGRLEEVG